MSLIDDHNFDKLRDLIAKEVGLQTVIFNCMKTFDFFGKVFSSNTSELSTCAMIHTLPYFTVIFVNTLLPGTAR